MIIISLLIQIIKDLFEYLIKPTTGFFKLKEDGRDLLFHLGILRGVKITDGDVKNEGKICVFASYQPSGINPLLLYYIKYLKEVMGFAIIFTSNCKLSAEDKEKLKVYTYKIVERANVGRDIGSYKWGILHFEKEIKNAKLFLLTNDSVYGPIKDLTRITKVMEEEGYDYISETMSDSLTFGKHPCSYFILMNSKIINSEAFWNFWKNKLQYKSSRKYVIRRGEVKFGMVFSQFYGGSLIALNDYVNAISNLDKQQSKRIYLSNKRDYLFKIDNICNIQDSLAVRSMHPSDLPIIALSVGHVFIKKDWVKKAIIADVLIDEIKKNTFSTDIDKNLVIKQITKDSFLDKKTMKLIKKVLL